MSNSAFPTLLNRKAKIFAGLNRSDLMVVGGCYLVLSWLRVSGITALVINALVLFSFKIITRKLPKGFFREINASKALKWSYKLGRTNG